MPSKSERPEPEEQPLYRSLDDPDTLRLLMQNLGEGIYITDPQGQILDANPAFLEIFGVSSLEELSKYKVANLLVQPEQRRFELEQLERDGSVRDFELEIARPDGQRRTVLDATYAVRHPVTGEVCFHGILVDISHRKALENQLREQLTRDALTGCFNRRFLLDFGEKLRHDPDGRWGCIFLDIDHFKLYNDRHGHQSGDHALQKMARFLMRQVRSEEPVIRMGGDEFLIVLTGDNASRTEDVATRLQHAAARSAPVAFSLGWAQRAGEEPFEATVDRADRKLIGVRVLSRSGDWPRLPDEMERRKR